MTIVFLGLYQEYISNRATLGVVSGLSMAIFETGIICPFERLKVWLMTASERASIKMFFNRF